MIQIQFTFSRKIIDRPLLLSFLSHYYMLCNRNYVFAETLKLPPLLVLPETKYVRFRIHFRTALFLVRVSLAVV